MGVHDVFELYAENVKWRFH